jgi:hypothetical protein
LFSREALDYGVDPTYGGMVVNVEMPYHIFVGDLGPLAP